MNIEQLYRADIADIPDWRKLSRPEQSAVCERARKGDRSACEEIICALLPYCLAYATKIQCGSILAMDLVSVASLTILEYFDRALPMKNPPGYLFKCALGQMYSYKRRYGNAITMPAVDVGALPYEVYTINDRDPDEFVAVILREVVQDHSPLYAAVASLTPKGREMLMRLFGLSDSPQETLSDIAGGDSATTAYKSAEQRKWQYFKTCLRFIEKYHPDYMRAHTSAKARSIPAHASIVIPERVRQKLDQARIRLIERGEKLSGLKLTREAHTHGQFAAAYLHELRVNHTLNAAIDANERREQDV